MNTYKTSIEKGSWVRHTGDGASNMAGMIGCVRDIEEGRALVYWVANKIYVSYTYEPLFRLKKRKSLTGVRINPLGIALKQNQYAEIE